MPNKPNHPDHPDHPEHTPESLSTKTPAGTVGHSAFGLSHNPFSHLPRPQTSVMTPSYPANHLEERLRVIPLVKDDDDQD